MPTSISTLCQTHFMANIKLAAKMLTLIKNNLAGAFLKDQGQMLQNFAREQFTTFYPNTPHSSCVHLPPIHH